MAAGQLTVELLAKTASFETDTARAGKALLKFERDAARASASFRTAFKASFAGNLLSDFTQQAGQGIVRLIGAVLPSIDAFNDLRDATGASIEGISAIDRVARETGVGFGTVETALIKLNKALSDAKPDSDAARALQAIGLSAKELKSLDPAEALRKVAVALSGYADDGNKARLVQELLGKSMKEVAPLLVDLAEKGELVASTTTQQAKEAEAFRKEIFKLRADLEDLARTILVDLLPSLSGFTAKLRELFGGAKSLHTVTTEVKQLQAQLDQLKPLEGKGFTIFPFFGSEDERKKRIAKIETQLTEAQKRFNDITNPNPFAAYDIGVVPRSVDFKDKATKARTGRAGRAAPIDDPTRKLFDNQLKELQAFLDEERDLTQTRNRFLDLYNNQNLLSTKSYYDSRVAIVTAGLTAEKQVIDQELALIQKRQSTPGVSQRETAELEGKREDLIRRRAEVERKAAEEITVLTYERAQAEDKVRESVLGVQAQTLELKEAFAEAAAIKFDQQFGVLSKIFDAEGNAIGKEALATLRAAALAQADYQKATLGTSRSMEDLAILEERLALAQQTGATGSLEALVKLGELRRAQIPVLEAYVAAEEAIARAALSAGTAGADELTRNAARARLALDKLKAAADPLAESLNKAFGDEFQNALDDFVTGTKSAEDAIKSLGKAWLNELLRMGNKSLTETLFGGSGGVGGFISDLFKSGGARNIFGAGPNTGAGEVGGVPQNAIADLFKDTGATAARSAETAAISANTAALTALGTAAASATAALSAISATGSETGSGISAVLTDVFKDSTAARSAETDAISTSTAAMTALATVASSNVATMTDLGSAATAVASALVTLSTLSTTTGTATKAASSFNWEDIVSWFSSLGTRAAGGPVMHSRTYLVGERGPELFVPERSGSIVPHHRLQDLPAQVLKTGRHDVLAPRHDDIVLKDKLKEVWKISEVLRTSEKDREIWREKLGRSFGGARAQGGPVSKSKTYMVGERGPELFIPKQSGSIVPNHRLKKIEEDEEILKARTSRPRALEKLVSRLGPFGGARADGVTPSKVYVVGEKSPEWFVPAALKAQDVFRQDSVKRQAEQIFYTRNVPLKSQGLVSSLGRAPSVPVELKFNDLEVRVEEGREKLIPPRLFGGVRAGPVVYTAGESEPVLIPQQIPQQLGVPTLKDWSVDALKGPTDVLAARSVAPQLVPSKMAAELGKMEMVGLKGSELLVERNSENEKLRETNNSILRTFRSEQKVREVWRENLSWPGSFEGAKDGSVISNETSIVGEKGPELFVSKQDHLKEVLRSNDAMSLMRSDAIVTNNLREVMATTDVLRERENRLERLYQPLQPHIKGNLPSGASTSSKAETGWFVPKVPKASEVLKTSSLTQIVGAQGPDLFAPERSVVTNHRLQTEEVLKAPTTAPVLDERLGNLVSRLGGVLDEARTAGGPITASNQKDSVSTVTAGQIKHAEQIIISAKSIVPRLKTDEAWRDELVALLGRFGGARVTGGPVAASKPYLVGGRELFVAAGKNSVVSNTIQSNLSMPKWFDDLLVSWGGARAVGGPVTMNKAYMVGERGPEMFVPGQNGTVTPNNRLGGTTKNINVNVSMPQGANRETGSQFGAAIARRLAIEDSRNN